MSRPVGISPAFAARSAKKGTRKFELPHSPWQKAVSGRMEDLNISTRELSSRLSKAKIDVTHVKLWGWLRHKAGYPGRTYTLEINHAIAHALDFPPQELDRLLDLSRALSSTSLKDRGLHALRRIIEESPRKTWTKAEILREIDSLS
jgi:hypothetical protein